MKKRQFREIYHDDFYDIDLPTIESSMEAEEFDGFLEMMNHEFWAIQRNPIEHSGPCRFPPLSTNGYRKIKFCSSVDLLKAHEKPDMRIIYRFDEEKQCLYYLAIGRRVNGRPRPKDDVYSTAVTRDPEYDEE